MKTASRKIKVGVLALQGAFRLHQPHIIAAGAEYHEVLTETDLLNVDALILPGGESSAMLKLIESQNLTDALSDFFRQKPTWGICAGAILLANKVQNPPQKSFRAIDVEIQRNGYGRQLDSAEELVDGFNVAYIRAPKISVVGTGVEVLWRRDDIPTWVEFQNIMVTAFHPELNHSLPSPWHKRLVAKACL